MTYISRASLGLRDELINGGSIRNWGEEITAGWKQEVTSNLPFGRRRKITFLKNEVTSSFRRFAEWLFIASVF